ncbi:MAG: dihydroorotate oxidase [Fibrobacterales bacterium]
MSTIKIHTEEVMNHDYERTMGDFFLDVIKKVVSDPEIRHDWLPRYAKYSKFMSSSKYKPVVPIKTVVNFPDKSIPLYMNSPIILAAGSNKYGENLPDFSNLGFGGVAVGTVTRSERDGNLFRPRVAMIPADRAINNSMGLNNPGVDVISKIVDRDLIKAHKRGLAIGVSMAESPEVTDEEEQLEQMLYTFRKAYNVADYIEINVSCPNTGVRRTDENTQFLSKVLSEIMEIRKNLPIRKAVYCKLSPDMNEQQFIQTLKVIRDNGINGLILFNTFPGAKSKFLNLNTPQEKFTPVTSAGGFGGLSGRPLYINTYRAVEYIKKEYPEMSVIASGGIDHGRKVFDLLELGVDAVQCYSALAYRMDPVNKMNYELSVALKEKGYCSLEEYYDKKNNPEY